MKVSVIIPAFNEARYIKKVIDEVLSVEVSPHELEVIVSNDASTDDTMSKLVGFDRKIKVVSSAINRGKAAAVIDGLEHATGEVTIIQDADSEYYPSDYPALLKPFSDKDTVAVFGSRFLKNNWPSGMPFLFWVGNKVFTHALNLLYGSNLTDEGTAYKVIKTGLMRSLSLSRQGFNFDPEVTAKLLKKGVRIIEVPIDYKARSKEEGKKPAFKDGLKVLWTLFVLRFKD